MKPLPQSSAAKAGTNLCVGVTRTACKNLPRLQHLSWTHENWLNRESFRKLSTQCKTVPCQLTESKQWKTYIQILRQVSRMQWGISQDIFNTKYSLPQLDLITWFLLSWVSMLLFQLPLFKTVAAHRNCGVKLRDCFLLQNPLRSALCRGLLAPAEDHHLPQGGLTAAPCRVTLSGQSPGQRQPPPSNQWGRSETLVSYFPCSLHTWRYLSHSLFLLLNDQMSRLQGRTSNMLQLVGFLCKFNSISLPNFRLMNTEETT